MIEYLIEIETEFENTLACLSGAQMGSNREKIEVKSSWHTPFKPIMRQIPLCFRQCWDRLFSVFDNSSCLTQENKTGMEPQGSYLLLFSPLWEGEASPKGGQLLSTPPKMWWHPPIGQRKVRERTMTGSRWLNINFDCSVVMYTDLDCVKQ